jgi:nucleotide-binding universal stress UspA family protein
MGHKQEYSHAAWGMFFANNLRGSSKSNGGPVINLKKILAPTDLSKLSRPAVRYALELALERGAAVLVYLVISEDSEWIGSDDRLNPANALLAQQRERLHAFMAENFAELTNKLAVVELVEAGVPYNRIVDKAKQEHADLIVMSTHGRTGFEQVLLGSVTAKVVARAICPVLSIRPTKSSAH